MALIKCPDCGTEVSTNAVTCPKCGRVMESAAGAVTKAEVAPLLGIIHLILGCIIGFASLVNYDLGPQRLYIAAFGFFLIVLSLFSFLGRKRWAYLTLGIMDIMVFLGIFGAIIWFVFIYMPGPK